MCEFCCTNKNNEILGRTIRHYELKKTAGYEPPKNEYDIDFLELFILKLKEDKKAGLMLNNKNGARYIDINYCPMCRKEAGRVNCKECKYCKQIGRTKEYHKIETLFERDEKTNRARGNNTRSS